MYRNLEQLLIKTAQGEDVATEFDFVSKFYKDDLEPEVLQAQLLTFGIEFRQATGNDGQVDIFDIKNYFSTLSSPHKVLLSEVCVVLKLVLVMPATNATSERSFSTLRRLKTYLRNSMTQQRLNNLMVLHVHKDLTDRLDLASIVNEFIGESEHRTKFFGN